MDWAGWALFGLMTAAALTAVMIAAQLAGLIRLGLPLVLGTLATEDPDRARVARVLHPPATAGAYQGPPRPSSHASCSGGAEGT